jgi:aryl-alcohol dehydrogenase-like predicted oxidoreductase
LPVTNKIILGTVQFGLEYGINNHSGKPGIATVTSILDLAFENGIHLLDTAEAYGNSQEVIGEYHRRSSRKFGIITKFSDKRNDLSDDLIARVTQNMKILDVDFLSGYMFHSFRDFETYYDSFKDQLSELKKIGAVKKFGVSIYTNEEFAKLLAYPGIDFIQLPFNLLDNNSQRSELITKAKQAGIEIHTRSVFLQGLFFKKDLPEKLKALAPYLGEIRRISSDHKISLEDLALNYVVQQSTVDRVLIGVDTPEQLKTNLASLKNRISTGAIDEIDRLRITETELLNPSTWKN